jgi:hypothetical protein
MLSTTSLNMHRFRVFDYHKMGESGILGEDSRQELIDGIVVDVERMSPQHAAQVNRLVQVFVMRMDKQAIGTRTTQFSSMTIQNQIPT